MTSPIPLQSDLSRAQMLLLLRWLLIVTTAYLLLFSDGEDQITPGVGLFVAAYFSSNIALKKLLPRIRSVQLLHYGVVLFDTAATSLALLLAGNVSHDFFVLFFLVVFLGALTERLGLVVAAAALCGIVHLTTLAQFIDPAHLIHGGYIIRIPFLFVVALFFGHLVEDETRARDRMRADFLSSVSHDIKNPLGVIQSMSEILLDANTGPLNHSQADLVRRIHANVRRVITLALNLLDAARIDAGRLILQRSPQSLSDVVEDAMSVASSAGQVKGVTLHLVARPNLPPVDIDFTQMERAISNLLDNAIKYTPEGGSVTALLHGAGDQVVLAVRDSGPGIPADEIAALFGKYQRRASSTRTAGSGLGLFIVQAIVEAHGGRVAMESTVGRGTAVTVCLPLATARPTTSHPPDRPNALRPWNTIRRLLSGTRRSKTSRQTPAVARAKPAVLI